MKSYEEMNKAEQMTILLQQQDDIIELLKKILSLLPEKP